jgi:hypothetical protein
MQGTSPNAARLPRPAANGLPAWGGEAFANLYHC